MKCFFHSADLDGHCSGAIVKYKFPECELFGIDYGEEFPWDTLLPGEKIFIVDFGLEPYPLMERLDKLGVKVVWIDHHKSSIEEYRVAPLTNVYAILNVKRAACELVWCYLFDDPMPKGVHLLGRYDVWDHSDPDTLPFQYGMRLRETDPMQNMSLWINIFNTFRGDILQDGKLVLNYAKKCDKDYVGTCSFETELDGLHCIAANKMLANSQLFDTIWDESKYDAMLTFGWRGGQWHVSLYTTKDGVDVSTIAKAHGGGGHKKAAGFQCKVLPFELR